MPILMPPPEFEIPKVPVRKFSVSEYHRLAAAGILTEHDRVELLEGWIVPKTTHNPYHDSTVQLINDQLREYLPVGWSIRVQSAITLEDSEPEPDIAVVFGDNRTFRHRHPEPADVGLVIEVAESTLQQDRTEKYVIYAKSGISNYWIVNLVDEQVEVFSSPRGAGRKATYRQKAQYRPGQSLTLNLGGHRLDVQVDDLIDCE